MTKLPILSSVLTVALLGTSLSALPAPARVLPRDLAEHQDAVARSFTSGPGFGAVDPASFWTRDWYSKARFPHAKRDTVYQPGHDISAVVRAILVVEKQEKPLKSARYRIKIRRVAGGPDYPDAYVDLIEVSRFNLGPLRRRAAKKANPGAPVAPANVFGIGPNVTWRFAMRPIQGMRAAVERAARHVLRKDEAAAADCLGSHCLSLDPVSGPSKDWQRLPPAQPHEVVFRASDGVNATPAKVADALIRRALPDGLRAQIGTKVPAQVTVVISRNVVGSDASIIGLLHLGQLRDDSMSDIWLQRLQAGPGTIEWRRQVEHWPGRN